MWIVPNNWVLHQIYVPCKVLAFDNGIFLFYVWNIKTHILFGFKQVGSSRICCVVPSLSTFYSFLKWKKYDKLETSVDTSNG